MARPKSSTTEVAEDLYGKYLPNKKVILKPTPREGQIVSDPKHKLYFLAEDAVSEWMLPISGNTGRLIDVFESLEEREFFENLLDVDLNPLNNGTSKVNFWHTFRVRITRTPNLLEDGVTFDLSNPIDNLKVKVLKRQEDIAPSWDKRKKHPKFRWVLVDETQEYVTKASSADDLAEAYAHFASIKHSETKMIEFLRIYGASNNKKKIVPKDAKLEFLKGEVSNIINSDIKGYLSTVKNGDFEIKILLENALQVGAVEDKYNQYVLPGGDTLDPLDGSYRATINKLKEWSNPKSDGHEKYLTIKARIDNAK